MGMAGFVTIAAELRRAPVRVLGISSRGASIIRTAAIATITARLTSSPPKPEVNGADVQTIGEEGDEAMRFDPLLQLVVDRSQSEIVLEGFECRLDLEQLNVELPQLGGVFPR